MVKESEFGFGEEAERGLKIVLCEIVLELGDNLSEVGMGGCCCGHFGIWRDVKTVMQEFHDYGKNTTICIQVFVSESVALLHLTSTVLPAHVLSSCINQIHFLSRPDERIG